MPPVPVAGDARRSSSWRLITALRPRRGRCARRLVGFPPAVSLNGACPLRSGSRVTLVPLFTLKYAHVLVSPSRAASSGPLTGLLPREPSTSAATIRGEMPRLSTSMPRKDPFTKPLSRAAAEAKLRLSFQLEDFVS